MMPVKSALTPQNPSGIWIIMHQQSKRQASFNRLATGHISTRRSDILLASTDTFCSNERPDQTEINQYRELFYSLISETDEVAKRLIASSLAKHPYTPRQILLYFALETAAIAAPVLAYAKGLGQFDLIQIIEKTTNLHHRVIANRSDLGSTVVANLIETGDTLTLRRLKQNPAIDVLNNPASKPSTEGIVEPSGSLAADNKSSHPTGMRAEDPRPMAARDSRFTRSRQNKKIVLTAKINSHAHDLVKPDDMPAQTAVNPKAQTKVKHALDELVALANRGKRLGSIDDLLEDVARRPVPEFGDILLGATIRKNRQQQIAAIQTEFGLSATTASKVFEDHSGDTLAVLLKAAGVKNQTALQVITQSMPNVGLSEHNTQRMSKIYPALDSDICMTTVLSWRKPNRQDRTPYHPVTADVVSTDNRTTQNRPVITNRKQFGRAKKQFGT